MAGLRALFGGEEKSKGLKVGKGRWRERKGTLRPDGTWRPVRQRYQKLQHPRSRAIASGAQLVGLLRRPPLCSRRFTLGCLRKADSPADDQD